MNIRRVLVVIVLALSVSVAALVRPAPVSALGATQLKIHVAESDQYLYTQLYLPAVSLSDVQNALPLLSLTFAGQPVMVQSITDDTAGVWDMEVTMTREVAVGDNFLGLTVMGPTPVSAGLNVVVVERDTTQQWPVCDAWTAAWQGPHGTACVMALKSPVVVPPVDPVNPGPIEPEPTPKHTPQTTPVALPSYTVESPLTLANPAQKNTPPEKSTSKDTTSSVLGNSAAPSLAATSAASPSFKLTPVTAAVSVVAGLGVAGAMAFVADKLGLIKPKP